MKTEESVNIELEEKKLKSYINKNELKKNSENSNALLIPVPENGIKQLEDKNEKKRIQWTNYFEYMLSVTGFVIDLGNVINHFYY